MTSDVSKPQKPTPGTPGTEQPGRFTAVAGMSDDARRLADAIPNPLSGLTAQIRTLAASEVDPYLLVGVLLEGMVHLVSTRIPPDRQPDTVMATLVLLQQRMRDQVAGLQPHHRCGTTTAGEPD